MDLNGKLFRLLYDLMFQVMIASSKREGSIRDPKEDEKNLRLFVIVPKSYSRDDLRKEFEVEIVN